MDVEDEGEVSEVITGALGVTVVMTDRHAAIPGPNILAQIVESTAHGLVSVVWQEEDDWFGEVD